MTGVSEVLRAAADVLKERGWTQCGDWQDDATGCLCVEGAIATASGIPFGQAPYSEATLIFAEKIIGNRHAIVPDWNDEVATSQEQVIADLHRAADLHEATHSAASLGEGRDGLR